MALFRRDRHVHAMYVMTCRCEGDAARTTWAHITSPSHAYLGLSVAVPAFRQGQHSLACAGINGTAPTIVYDGVQLRVVGTLE